MQIKRLNNIEQIIALQENFYKSNGIYPFNVSNWTVSSYFRKNMEKYFEYNFSNSPIDYLYSYSITDEVKYNVMQKLGIPKFEQKNRVCIFFPNNSISIVNVCNLLQKIHCKNIGILYPAYFSIESCLNSYGVTHTSFYVTRHNGHYRIPIEEIMNSNVDSIWITSPIYSTGTTYCSDDIIAIEFMLKNDIIVIADESLCVLNHELIRHFSKYDNFIGIYSPHKAISFNSFKFSALVCDDSYEDFFDQWLDVFCGNLPQTSIAAIYHYLSDNYTTCYNAFETFINKARKDVLAILKNFPNIETDSHIYCNLMTLYIKNLDFKFSKDINFLNEIIQHTQTLFYPSYLNGFSEEIGFSFRINLALYGPDFLASLQRLLVYLSDSINAYDYI